MNYWKKFIGDYQRDTMHLTMIQDGAYNRLLDALYANERPLPSDPESLYRIARAFNKEERKAVDSVVNEFFVLGADGYVQTRATKEIKSRRDQGVVNARIARDREEARKQHEIDNEERTQGARNEHETGTNGQPSIAIAIANNRKPEPQPKPNPEKENTATASPSLRTKRGKTLKGGALERFLKFWSAFAYKRGKAEAADAWLLLNPDDALTEQIVIAAAAEAKRRPSIVQARQTPKMAQGWITARRWEDEDAPALPSMNRNGHSGFVIDGRVYHVPDQHDDAGMMALAKQFGVNLRGLTRPEAQAKMKSELERRAREAA